MSFLESLKGLFTGEKTHEHTVEKTPEHTIDLRNKNYWEEYRTADGKTGHRISLEKMSPEEIEKLEKDLTDLRIHFFKKNATTEAPEQFQSDKNPVKPGDRTLIVVGQKDVARLRVNYFGYYVSNPIEYDIAEDTEGHETLRVHKAFKFPAAPLTREETDRTASFPLEETLPERVEKKADYTKWDKLSNGWRLNVSNFSQEELDYLRNKVLHGIPHVVRTATTKTETVKPGDRTVRVTGEDAVQALETQVFNIDPEPTVLYEELTPNQIRELRERQRRAK